MNKARSADKMRNTDKIVVARPEGNRPLEYLGANKRIILKWILRK
jgi:hypothetical protein